jgi:glycosyltransferase involved in cell wall biosynthesis
MNGYDVVNILILISLLVFAAIALVNFLSAPRLKDSIVMQHEYPLISILIPARNEEKNIGKCLNSVMQTKYPNCEVIVYDDESIDRTADIVKQYADIQLIRGTKLPPGWIGKSYACDCLSKAAKGKYLLFIDADVEVTPNAIQAALQLLEAKKASMISCFPHQEMKSLGELLTIPLLHFVLLGFLPLIAVYKRPAKRYAAAIGQFILINRSAYDAIGGHAAVKDNVVDDMGIARKLKENGFITVAALSGNLINCRMYEKSIDAIRGFGKNLFKGFNLPKPVFFLILHAIEIVFILPIILAVFSSAYYIHVLLIILIRTLIARTSGQSALVNILLHVPQLVVFYCLGIYSLYKSNTHGVLWKGRFV